MILGDILPYLAKGVRIGHEGLTMNVPNNRLLNSTIVYRGLDKIKMEKPKLLHILIGLFFFSFQK